MIKQPHTDKYSMIIIIAWMPSRITKPFIHRMSEYNLAFVYCHLAVSYLKRKVPSLQSSRFSGAKMLLCS